MPTVIPERLVVDRNKRRVGASKSPHRVHTRVDDIVDAVDGEGCLGNVGRQNHLTRARRSRFENLGLLL